MRRIFIGDIQGCLAPLERLLRELALRSDDRVCCLGDLVSRGPDSLGVLRKLRDIGARSVLGNHDLKLLRLAGSARLPIPDDLQPALKADDAPALLTWLAAQRVMLVEDDIVAVHAGIHPHWRDLAATAARLNRSVPAHVNGSRDDRITFATEVRYCDADGRRPAQDEPAPAPPFVPWDDLYRGSHMAVFGHWARRGLVTGPRVRGLDTGCVYGGRLTAWIAEEDRLVSVAGLDSSQARIIGAN